MYGNKTADFETREGKGDRFTVEIRSVGRSVGWSAREFQCYTSTFPALPELADGGASRAVHAVASRGPIQRRKVLRRHESGQCGAHFSHVSIGESCFQFSNRARTLASGNYSPASAILRVSTAVPADYRRAYRSRALICLRASRKYKCEYIHVQSVIALCRHEACLLHVLCYSCV